MGYKKIGNKSETSKANLKKARDIQAKKYLKEYLKSNDLQNDDDDDVEEEQPVKKVKKVRKEESSESEESEESSESSESSESEEYTKKKVSKLKKKLEKLEKIKGEGREQVKEVVNIPIVLKETPGQIRQRQMSEYFLNQFMK